MAPTQTVLLTGASGYIGKHIALRLLNAGYNVVGSVRSLARSQEVTAAVAPHLTSTDNLATRLRFVALDLGHDTGWHDAMDGIDALIHTASPFPMAQPKNEDDLIVPAVQGTLRALTAAHGAGIKRVVLTSSFAAMMDSDLHPGKSAYDEGNWSDPNRPTISPYSKSKTLAERAAWDFVRDAAPDMALTVINPTIALGAPLDAKFGTSVEVVERLLKARDPMLPRFGLGIVDVRDVAEMHVRALSVPASAGKRFLAADRFLWFQEIAQTLKDQYPDRRIVTRLAPNFVIRVLGIFDKAIRQITPILGVRLDVSNARAREILDMDFIPAATSIAQTAEFLLQNDTRL